MNRYILPLLSFLILLFTASCLDDIKYESIGEGEASVSATIKFHPLIASNLNDAESRTEGDAIRTIRNIQIFIYSPKDELIEIKRYGEGYTDNFDEGKNTEMPSDIDKKFQSESKTMTATCKISNLPYGRYKMYAVANYPDISKEDAQTPLELKNHRASWDQSKISNNDQMFGCFADDDQSEYKDAPILVVNKPNITLNAWIKRLASKVTIVYDGQGLHEGINIYIKSVSVRDIPTSCVLGFDEEQLRPDQKGHGINGNAPSAENQLIDEPENGTLYYKTVYQSELTNEVDSVVTTSTNPNVKDYEQWLHINKSVKAIGAVETKEHKYVIKEEGSIRDTVKHTENEQALFFYENCQGNYPGDKAYNKQPFTEDVGKDENMEGIYKDKVPCGTFIEVEGYYVSTNSANQSSGPIKYRFMLGQDVTYNYNALRNRHYKLTLKFRGYANQPEWHIVYNEEEPGMYLQDYMVSYMYNTRHEMPIRLTGHPYKVTLQIVENNWAPYDSTQTDSVAPASVGTGAMDFKWYKDLYDQNNVPTPTGGTSNAYQNYSPKPASSYDGLSGYYYGKHKISDYITKNLTEYDPPLPASLRSGAKELEVTPIWAGFLALQVPSYYNSYSRTLPTGIQDVQGTDNYPNVTTVQGMRQYYTGKGGTDTGENASSPAQSNNGVELFQCTYDFTNNLPNADNTSVQVKSEKGGDADGRNGARLTYNGDGSYTIYPPLFTMPKSIGYITGFSGNNPYEAYMRRAKVLITAYYKIGDKNYKITKLTPVFQQQRLVNPKGVWRTGDNQDDFNVRLMYLKQPNDSSFSLVESKGEWSAWVATPTDEQTPNKSSFIELVGAKNGVVEGVTGSKIDFVIRFTGTTTGSQCAKVIIKYHGNNCEHAVFVRQGYNTPLAIIEGGKRWSSFSVFAFQGPDLTTAQATNPSNISSTQNFPAEMTVNPLALGTMFKRGNYGMGIRIINNKTYPVMERIGSDGNGPLKLVRLVNGKRDDSRESTWNQIYGIRANSEQTRNWSWSNFHSSIITSGDNEYNYDVPTYEDYTALAQQDFGIGVVYANGATDTQMSTSNAYGYFNDGNSKDMITSENGMRGIIVYNRTNFNQIFFPLGYSGVGRRTVQILPSPQDGGYLRYGATYFRLSTGTNANNQYRPVTYNIPASPGALYWMKTAKSVNNTWLTAWDINYFDLSFNAYDAASENPNGDAIPLKPVVAN